MSLSTRKYLLIELKHLEQAFYHDLKILTGASRYTKDTL